MKPTAEALPVEDIAPKENKSAEAPVSNSDHSEKVEESAPSEDEKKEEHEVVPMATNTSAPPTVEVRAPEEQISVASSETTASNGSEERAPAGDDEKPIEVVLAGEHEEQSSDTEPTTDAALNKETKDVEETTPAEDTKSTEEQAEDSSQETTDVEAGAPAADVSDVEAPAEPTSAADSEHTKRATDDTEPVEETAPVDDVKVREEPRDIEEGIPPTTLEADKAPESPSREKDLTVEHGIPPETPVRDTKKDVDPDSPSRETELEESFDSSVEAVGGDYEATKRIKRRRKHFIFGTISLVLIVGAVLGILFGTGVVRDKNNEPAPVSSPPDVSDGDTPTTAPTNTPAGDVPGGDAPAPPPVTETPPPDDPILVGDPLLDVIKGFSANGLDDSTSPQFKAYQWMTNEDPLSSADTDPGRLQQRYSMATMYAALVGEIPFYATRDECQWPSVECATHNATNLFGTQPWQITEVNLAGKSLTGTIPPEIGLLAPSLVHLDLSENPTLTGSIPEELYGLLNLKYLYLSNNAMTGTLSESIGNLQLLDSLYLGNNSFSGPIPYSLGSRGVTRRPMRYLILYNNEFEGTIPNEMNLRQMFHMDLSFNNLSGTLPADIGDDFNRLKQLYLDHNEFTGTIPDTYAQAGGGRLYVLALDNNQLTGGVPTGWEKDNLFIDTITVQGNELTEAIDKEICQFSALQNGELVQLGADCEICTCNSLCGDCYW